MKHIAQFEARLTWGGLTNSNRTALEPVKQACIAVAKALFDLPDSTYRQDALMAQLNVWNYAITCVQQPQAAHTGAGAAA